MKSVQEGIAEGMEGQNRAMITMPHEPGRSRVAVFMDNSVEFGVGDVPV